MIDRRTALLGIATSSLVACSDQGERVMPDIRQTLSLPQKKLIITKERIVSELVGLRPARTGGFRLSHETHDGKHRFHNYGHGGDGFTVSWPCADWIADRVTQLGVSSATIIGAGVSGLTTAASLAKRGVKITIRSQAFYPDITSRVAGALVLKKDQYRSGPYLSFEQRHHLSDRHINETLENGFAPFLHVQGSGVYTIDYFRLGQNRKVDALAMEKAQHFLGLPILMRSRTIMVDPTYYLPMLMDILHENGARFLTDDCYSSSEFYSRPEQVVINCAGMGALEVASDQTVYPVRGQLTLINGNQAISYGYGGRDETGIFYMFPRKESVVLGGSYDSNIQTINPDPLETLRHIRLHAQLMSNST